MTRRIDGYDQELSKLVKANVALFGLKANVNPPVRWAVENLLTNRFFAKPGQRKSLEIIQLFLDLVRGVASLEAQPSSRSKSRVAVIFCGEHLIEVPLLPNLR